MLRITNGTAATMRAVAQSLDPMPTAPRNPKGFRPDWEGQSQRHTCARTPWAPVTKGRRFSKVRTYNV